jgi:hypothetical protein
VLLPAVSSLARLAAQVRAQATDRLYQRLSALASAEQARLLIRSHTTLAAPDDLIAKYRDFNGPVRRRRGHLYRSGSPMPSRRSRGG